MTEDGDRDRDVADPAADFENLHRTLPAGRDHADDAGQAVSVRWARLELGVPKPGRSASGRIRNGFRFNHQIQVLSGADESLKDYVWIAPASIAHRLK
jgi:hypothetical protein